MTHKDTIEIATSATRPSLGAFLARLIEDRVVPSATYRMQFNADFTLDDAAALVPYLSKLGISHIYASPLFAARAGSTHGYDVCDPTRLSTAVGGEEALARLSQALSEHGMNMVLDVVPNHMGINDPCNAWWLDVLENGPSSLYAPFFDISWDPFKPELKDRVLLPVLEDQYGAVLEAGKLKLAFSEGAFRIEYYDNRFPVAPGTYTPVLQQWASRVRSAAAAEGAAEITTAAETALELDSIVTAVGYLPARNELDIERRLERAREKEIIKRRLATVWQSSAAAFNSLQETLAAFNGDPADPHSFDALDALLEKQAYRLAFWRVAGEEINYRRFFDIRDLAAIRVEDPQVFEATNALALRLLAEGKIEGLRIDHPDGLFHPTAYFRRLQQGYLLALLKAEDPADENGLAEQVESWLDAELDAARHGRHRPEWPLYVLAEKILSDTEPLPQDWAVAGTTGYDFLASVNAVLVNPATEKDLTRIYSDFSGEDPDFDALTVRTQRLIMHEALASEINELSHSLERVAERDRHTRDFTLNNLRDAIRSLVASLRVYRTYIDPASNTVSARDRGYILQAVERAQELTPHVDSSVFSFLQETLLLQNHERFRAEDRPALAHWVMKFQQMTGPVMAKGVEDTAFYRYNRLVSLNEVGGHPSLFGIDVAQFHRDNERRARYWPHSMLATSTHDNKRSEDVRARLAVLSELPGEWSRCIHEWSGLNSAHRTRRESAAPGGAVGARDAGDAGGGEGERFMPDRNDEYLLYQVLLGAWPMAQPPGTGARPAHSDWARLLPPGEKDEYEVFVERIHQYMNKAVKEAKVHGSWINPDEAYDEATRRFIDAILHPGPDNRFLAAFGQFAARVAFFGQINSLTQVALKLTSPGVPDIYQGNELWDLSLVDPDNRRPVDYEKRQGLLEQLPTGRELTDPVARELLEHSVDGRIKLFVTSRLLRWRRAEGALFGNSEYLPLAVSGRVAQHVIAFGRRSGDSAAVVIAPRLAATLSGGRLRWPLGPDAWDDARVALPNGLAGRELVDVLTGRRVQPEGTNLMVGEVLRALPLSVLHVQ